MARIKVKNMAELESHINKVLKNTLDADDNMVADIVKTTESDKVEEVVYDKYRPNRGEPWVYERRGTDGGLADTSNMEHEAQMSGNKVKMEVINTTPPHDEYNGNGLKDGDVASLVEGGDGTSGLEYSGKTNRSGDAYKYLGARPFQRETVAELKRNGLHAQALASELRGKGLNARKL